MPYCLECTNVLHADIRPSHSTYAGCGCCRWKHPPQAALSKCHQLHSHLFIQSNASVCCTAAHHRPNTYNSWDEAAATAAPPSLHTACSCHVLLLMLQVAACMENRKPAAKHSSQQMTGASLAKPSSCVTGRCCGCHAADALTASQSKQA
jgi:hypothetical protein